MGKIIDKALYLIKSRQKVLKAMQKAEIPINDKDKFRQYHTALSNVKLNESIGRVFNYIFSAINENEIKPLESTDFDYQARFEDNPSILIDKVEYALKSKNLLFAAMRQKDLPVTPEMPFRKYADVFEVICQKQRFFYYDDMSSFSLFPHLTDVAGGSADIAKINLIIAYDLNKTRHEYNYPPLPHICVHNVGGSPSASMIRPENITYNVKLWHYNHEYMAQSGHLSNVCSGSADASLIYLGIWNYGIPLEQYGFDAMKKSAHLQDVGSGSSASGMICLDFTDYKLHSAQFNYVNMNLPETFTYDMGV